MCSSQDDPLVTASESQGPSLDWLGPPQPDFTGRASLAGGLQPERGVKSSHARATPVETNDPEAGSRPGPSDSEATQASMSEVSGVPRPEGIEERDLHERPASHRSPQAYLLEFAPLWMWPGPFQSECQ